MKKTIICSILILLFVGCHSQKVATYENLAGIYSGPYSLRLNPDSTFRIAFHLLSNTGLWEIKEDSVILRCYRPKHLGDFLAGQFHQRIYKYKILNRNRLRYIPDMRAKILTCQEKHDYSNKEMSYVELQGTYTGKSVVNGLTYSYVLQLKSDSTYFFEESILDYKISCNGTFSISIENNRVSLRPNDFPLPAKDYDNDEKLRFYLPRQFKILDDMRLEYVTSGSCIFKRIKNNGTKLP